MSGDFDLSQYDFDLPASQIAQHPAPERDVSRLMVLAQQEPPAHHTFRDLPSLLQPGDVLVRNNTKVIPARLIGRRPTGGKSELLLVHPMAQAPETLQRHAAPDSTGAPQWLCLGRPASKLSPGTAIHFGEAGELSATVTARLGGGRVIVRFSVADDRALLTAVSKVGRLPLPPYISREDAQPSAADRESYQTTFAAIPGAVAAPTAGLHFTSSVDEALRARGVEILHVTLHVGPGTFRPMIAEDIREHEMDAEFYVVDTAVAERVNLARQEGRRVITVGTTSTRTLESVTDQRGRTSAGSGWTNLFIRPGYRFRAIDGLITNFHLPKSSLLVLVSTLMGRERILEAYRLAVSEGYRFYSYGDAMLLLP